MHKKIADALLIHTGHPISAVVSYGMNDEVLGILLFDTIWQAESVHIDPFTERIDLFSNHPEGCKTLYEEDTINYAYLKRLAGEKNVRLFIVSEYFACTEIALET